MARTTSLLTVLALAAATVCLATPSTLVWIPSTDIQAPKTWHFGVDDLFNVGTPDKQGTDLTDIGLTYGLCKGLEVGVDYFSGMDDPLFLNAKYSTPPFGSKGEWVASLGLYGFGFEDTVSQNIVYGLVSYRVGQDRLHLGYFAGADDVLTDPFTGESSSDGVLLGWDRSLGGKWWAAVDYQGSESAVGALSIGIAYSVSDNSSVLLSANFWNNDSLANTLTFQYDLNL